jgi:hypothetical protein
VPSDEEEKLYDLAMSDTSEPRVQIKMLAYRVAVLTREKEALETRVAKMERSFNMGAGVLLVLPILGSIMGLLIAFGKGLLAPWFGNQPHP